MVVCHGRKGSQFEENENRKLDEWRLVEKGVEGHHDEGFEDIF